jgi:AAA domain-containing protein
LRQSAFLVQSHLNQSPFNVGTEIELMDFTPEQVADLNHRHGSPLHTNQLQELMLLLSGQPFLVRRVLYLIASGQMSAADLFTHAADDGGPFGDHLRYHFFRLHDREDLLQGLRQVIRDKPVQMNGLPIVCTAPAWCV